MTLSWDIDPAGTQAALRDAAAPGCGSGLDGGGSVSWFGRRSPERG